MNRRGTSMTMPVSSADESARQLAQGIRQLIGVVNENTAAMRASLPQFFGADDLMKRWNRGHDQVVRLLETHAGYVGQRGHRLSVSLEDVLRIDEVLRREYEARKALRRAPGGVIHAGQEVAHAS